MKKIFAANWKLFKSPKETREFFAQWSEAFKGSKNEVVFFPSAMSLEAASTSIQKINAGYDLSFGVQNAYFQAQGAFTGENSAAVVKELGGKYVLIGHSERRQLFAEKNELLADKVAFTQGLGLVPMLCIGETLQEREAGQTKSVLKTQLTAGLAKADKVKTLVVAYEPVWAIGTGKVATPEQVQETHKDVFEILSTLGFTAPILYGGSVKPDNAAGLIQIPHVDGFLVGGASLEVPSFQKICSAI
ncbi:triose-phosphate isomerase [Bdellovibrio sp. HCB337]|uniref:triose-phosphate isomerase n=1 Tax=Bdellovibrio sp. HCB337 TaxID=3394358 RepID=UPI0039A5D503